MANEQEKTMEALKVAIQMEIDGKEYYLKASHQSGNELGKELLQKLSGEEDLHRQKFEEIYDAVMRKNSWPEVVIHLDGGKGLKTIFSMAVEELKGAKKAPSTELDTIQTAMNMENKTYDFYKGRSRVATYDVERGYYEALAAQERAHYLVLLDYYEFLKDPTAWFVEKEHPSLDGG